MEGMGLKFTPGMGRCLLRHSSEFRPIAGSSGTHSQSKRSLWMVWPASGFPLAPPPPTPYKVPSVILEWF